MTTRRWQEYIDFAHTGDWHVHTSYTDSEMPVAQVVDVAQGLGLGLVVFSEHVRRELTYSYGDFQAEVQAAVAGSPVRILPGAEAKVLDESGNLDVPEEALKRCALLSMAFHTSRSLTAGYIYKAVEGAVRNWPVDIWAHPANVVCGLAEEEAIEILRMASGHGVAIELNLKYSPLRFLELAGKARLPFVVGTDSHSAGEMRRRWGRWASRGGEGL